jgi:hypothetical protein
MSFRTHSGQENHRACAGGGSHGYESSPPEGRCLRPGGTSDGHALFSLTPLWSEPSYSPEPLPVCPFHALCHSPAVLCKPNTCSPASRPLARMRQGSRRSLRVGPPAGRVLPGSRCLLLSQRTCGESVCSSASLNEGTRVSLHSRSQEGALDEN